MLSGATHDDIDPVRAMTAILRPGLRLLGLVLAIALPSTGAAADDGRLRIAAASDLKFALSEIVEAYRARHPGHELEVIYGSSGKFHTQIRHGAPFDLYFSADIAYARALHEQGLTAAEPTPYAIGRIVLWSRDPELARVPLRGLPGQAALRRFAIANPDHAPYGRRAQEALEHEGVWEALAPRLVRGENIAHAAQFIDSGAAEAGIVALSLVKSPALADTGAWTLIPAEWHAPLEQAYVITRRARDNLLAAAFVRYLATPEAREVMRRYGFALPGE